jgi:predicted metal-dependent phosphotriesterase family hydrolase
MAAGGSSCCSRVGDVATSYAAAAADVGGIYLPVTQAWLEAWKRDASLALYSEDGFHPLAQGSYLAALVITGVLTGISPSQMAAQVVRPGGSELSIPPAVATVLRAAAGAAIASTGTAAPPG